MRLGQRGSMPELPDIVVYLEHLERLLKGHTLERIRFASPFLLRSVTPPISSSYGKRIRGTRRIGKRIVLELEGGMFLVIHLMIAGRLRWKERAAKIPGRIGLAAFDFENGTLIFTEASTKKRASLHLVQGEEGLGEHSRGGLEVLEADLGAFKASLTKENHTLKRALTDPRLFSGIGNAYSDEILHRARMSPLKQTAKLDDEEIEHLFAATKEILIEWTQHLREESREQFPENVTAFREGMAVHGRYKQPCPVCGSPVQRIAYAENETNYCARCQTGGKLLADRSLSRLLKEDWPKTLDEMEG
jgi:formamidopyrimidine-DNA glycosylase